MITDEIKNLQRVWQSELELRVPPASQFLRWLRYHRPEVLATAIKKAGQRSRFRSMDTDHAVRYISRIANDALFSEYEKQKVV